MVSAIKLPFLWLDVFKFLCNKLNFIVFFSHEKKISQILESLARKWNTLERNGLITVTTRLKQRESITLNSNFSWLKLCLVVPCRSSYPSFTVLSYPLNTMEMLKAASIVHSASGLPRTGRSPVWHLSSGLKTFLHSKWIPSFYTNLLR